MQRCCSVSTNFRIVPQNDGSENLSSIIKFIGSYKHLEYSLNLLIQSLSNFKFYSPDLLIHHFYKILVPVSNLIHD